tara:strand:- start:178 stop:333 length:156 start_codon:yes stop_codon:yes gene_type:complete
MGSDSSRVEYLGKTSKTHADLTAILVRVQLAGLWVYVGIDMLIYVLGGNHG